MDKFNVISKGKESSTCEFGWLWWRAKNTELSPWTKNILTNKFKTPKVYLGNAKKDLNPFVHKKNNINKDREHSFFRVEITLIEREVLLLLQSCVSAWDGTDWRGRHFTSSPLILSPANDDEQERTSSTHPVIILINDHFLSGN